MSNTLNVMKIFSSIDGEVNYYGQGRTSVFIRLAECNLKCKWCDSVKSQSKEAGKPMEVEKILDIVSGYGLKKVTVTGGEPLLQKDALHKLLNDLIYVLDQKVTVETNGTILPSSIISSVSYVFDYKLPSSGNPKFNKKIFNFVKPWDVIKFCIADSNDYEEALKVYKKIKKGLIEVGIAFSPIHGVMNPRLLAGWMIADKLDAILNLQLHKYINMP